MPHRGFLVVAAVSVIGGVPAFSQTSATSGGATSDKAAAYYEFIVGRQRESEGDIEGALSAYRRAAQLDPSSAEIHAEAAAMYARQNRADDAIAEAEAALKIDAANGEAHWVLGGVYAALVSSQAELGRSDGSPAVRGYAAKAILHLEKARDLRPNTPGLEVLLGRLYVAAGAYDRAIALLAEALAEDPGSSETSVLLAQAYWGDGRRDQAIRTLEDASSAVIESYRVLLELASFYERDEKWRQAADAYKRALDQNPSNPELKVRRASALINAGEGQAARDLMREVVKERPTEPAVLYLLSQAERQAKDLEAAEAAARRLIALAPRDLRGPFSLAQVFEHKHESRRVIETLQPIAEAPVNGPPRQVSTLLVHLAFAYQDVQQHDRALAAFERARKLAPDDDAIDSYLAQAHLAAHEPGKALEVARDALGRHPDNLRLLRLQAQALSQTGHLSEAVVMLQQEVTKRADPEAHLALAALFVEAKQLGEAEKILDSARAKFPEDVPLAFQHGAVLDQEKRHADAERVFRHILDRDPRHAPTLNYLGYMLAERGERLQESVGFVQRALEIDPHNGAYLDSLGWAYFKLRQWDLAEPSLREASEQLTMNSVVQDHFGDLMFELGRYGEAVAAWRRSLAGDGESIVRDQIKRKIELAQEKAQRK